MMVPHAPGSRCAVRLCVTYGAQCHKVELTRPKGTSELHITYCFANYGEYMKNVTDCKPEAEGKYFAPGTGYLDPTGLPLDRIRLQVSHEPGCHWF
jgi:hypothetical protein